VAELDENAAPEPQFCVRIENGGDGATVVVRLSGDLDIAGAPEARAVVEQALAQGPQRLTFDVSELRFMDSSGIAVLVAAAQNVDSVTLRDPSPVIERLLKLAGLAEVFHLTS
jgi:anti-sigma B factor antagonist